MRTLHISVLDKKATYLSRDGDIVCGNSDYVIEFVFDAEWDAHTEKVARFIWNGQYKDVAFTGTSCAAPIITNATEVEIGVYAGELSTTTPAVIGCQKSILCKSAPSSGIPFTKGEKGEKGDKGDPGEKGERGGTDNVRETLEITLKVTDWSDNKQTIESASISENSTLVVSHTMADVEAYLDSGIMLTDAEVGKMEFTCVVPPTEDIAVLVHVIDPLITTGSALPEITDEDEGKFVRVVGKAYALVALTDVSVEGA